MATTPVLDIVHLDSFTLHIYKQIITELFIESNDANVLANLVTLLIKALLLNL